jgi:hypothetical protein
MGETQVPRDGPRAGSDDPANASAPSTPVDPDANERKRHWLTEVICAAFDQQIARIKTLLAETSSRPPESESYLPIVAQCQKDTAAFANHVLERHALYPAVVTVDFLTGVIRQLSEQAAALAGGQTHCPLFQPLLDALVEAAKVAQAKYEYLDLVAICPQPFDDLDPDRHEIRQTVPTNEARRHRHVERTLIPGLIYRGTVLRRATISVYRHVEKA